MRIFNGTNGVIDLPLTGDLRLSIAAHTPSKDFAPNEDFLALIASSYTENDIALIVGGPFEISMCSRIASLAGSKMLVQSIDEAVEMFDKPKQDEAKPEEKEEVKPEPEPEKEVEEAPGETEEKPKAVKKTGKKSKK